MNELIIQSARDWDAAQRGPMTVAALASVYLGRPATPPEWWRVAAVVERLAAACTLWPERRLDSGEWVYRYVAPAERPLFRRREHPHGVRS